FLAAASRLLSKGSRPSFFVRPETLLGWHRQLVRRRWTYAGRSPGRPALSDETREVLVLLVARAPAWGASADRRRARGPGRARLSDECRQAPPTGRPATRLRACRTQLAR